MLRSLAVVLLFLSAPVVQAVGVDDAAGDVEFEAPGGSRTPVPGFEEVDILNVWMGDETDDAFTVGISVAGGVPGGFVLVGTQAPIREIHFKFDEVQYKVRAGSSGVLFTYNDAADLWREIGRLERIEAEGLAYIVPKELIRDRNAYPLRVGSSIEDLHGVAYRHPVSPDIEGRFIDIAPDSGRGPSLTMESGPGDFGDLSVFSPSPARASNGGPDTFVFPLIIENNKRSQTSVLLDVVNAPKSWETHVPPVVALDPGFTEVPVIVSTGSGHKHGETTEFNVTLTGEDSTTIGAYPLSVHYLTIPQLAGHHPMLHMHTGSPAQGVVDGALGMEPEARTAWFNTLDDDDNDSGYPIEGDGRLISIYDDYTEPTDEFVEWGVPMDPSLLIGMDFDMQQLAEFQVGLRSSLPVDGLKVSVDLLHCRPADPSGVQAARWGCDQGSWFRLAGGVQEDVSMAQEEVTNLEFVTAPEDYADLVPYQEGSNVLLHIRAEGVGLHYEAPFIAMDLLPQETWMYLPLNEFQDPVDQSFEDADALRIDRIQSFETRANPDQVHGIQFQVRDADAPRDLSVEVFGHHVEWIDAPSSVTSGTDGVTVSIDVHVPADASVGEFAEFFLVVEPGGDDRLGALSKARVTVVDEPVAPMEFNDDSKQAPGPTTALILGLVVGLAFMRRVRHN